MIISPRSRAKIALRMLLGVVAIACGESGDGGGAAGGPPAGGTSPQSGGGGSHAGGSGPSASGGHGGQGASSAGGAGASTGGHGAGGAAGEGGGNASGGGGDQAGSGAGGAAGDAGAGAGGIAGNPGGFQAPAVTRTDEVIDGSWKFVRSEASGAEASAFNDSAWSAVTLPHTWNAQDGQDGGGDYYRGVGWYRRHYTLPTAAAGKKVYLQFDAASTVADVYVNGTRLGQHRGAFGRFRFDATTALKTGADNVIAVKVSNANVPDVAPLAGDFTVFGGLYRDVHVLVTDTVHIDTEDYGSAGVYLQTKNVSATSAELTAKVRVKNNRAAVAKVNVKVTVLDAAGAVYATTTLGGEVPAGMASEFGKPITVANPHLWNGVADPYLYRAYAEVQVDGGTVDWVAPRFGFRFYSVDANQGFFLNGKYLDLHGVNRHQDRLGKGWAIGNAEHDEDFALMKELGVSAVRLAHYQHAEHVYDLADESGIVTWAEVPLVNTVTASAAFDDNAKQQLTELIRQNYNHPAIAFWSLENEEHGSPDPNPIVTALNELAHREDDSRLTTLATANDDAAALNWRADLTAFNKYYGWYDATSTIDDFAPWLDGIHRLKPMAKVAVSEFGAGSNINTHTLSPVPRDHSEEYQNLFHETYWKALASRKFIWGKYVWNMFDFAADDRNEGGQKGRNDKGLVTYDRKTRKDSFFWYQANWARKPMVYISSRRLTSRKTGNNPVKIYSNASSVELKLNGTSVGVKTSSDHIFTFTANLKSGSNQLQAVIESDGQNVTDTVTWNGG